MVIHTSRDPSIRVPRIEIIFKWLNEGPISPLVSHAFPIGKYKDAMREKLIGNVNGGCTLHFPEDKH